MLFSGMPLALRACPISAKLCLRWRRFSHNRIKASMRAAPKIEPRTMPRTVVEGNEDLEEPGAAAGIEGGTGLVVSAFITRLVDEGWDVEVEAAVEGIDRIESDSAPKIAVAFSHVFAFALNMHNMSMSFPPDMTTRPFESVAIE
ncbi:hypothetical protein RRF57_000181 [Xylaria bambusicola]|uniref:Uncharacterized protein n=1 Tax=Xylaria bambusicola TaxID=326684 RepID=A0AAN7U373_9PEZI